MKKIFIAISIILIILTIGIYNNSQTVKLFENVDTESVDEISIAYIGGSFSTEDKSQISEIMNYLKRLKFSKCSNNNVPNTTPDASISLIGKNQGSLRAIKIYGNVVRVYPKENDDYIVDAHIYDDLEKLCKKYKNSK
ncbi:hypothetical protein B0P06_001695 [Clostridium saccharoperbutylacetonicum]|nr:hypothetical protein [Clostridium saccharoperbutylacetonicum]NRT59246.1 hypothetical protein [Clostridium saccharoperbutylacetonicum]NSB28436.1 hypothetical protein [Clostridium saccharoperbutylacetonicum]NSB41924.1 hypothetical protein [Clostridium saccharoperbutylacetonicum]